MWMREKMSNGLIVEAKVYEEGSEFGIEGGRISKLWIGGNGYGDLAAYERGWSTEPTTPAAAVAVAEFIARHH